MVLTGCLYYVKFATNVIVRYEFASKSILKEKTIPKALYGNDAPYQVGDNAALYICIIIIELMGHYLDPVVCNVRHPCQMRPAEISQV